jgi:hypothetical protein
MKDRIFTTEALRHGEIRSLTAENAEAAKKIGASGIKTHRGNVKKKQSSPGNAEKYFLAQRTWKKIDA